MKTTQVIFYKEDNNQILAFFPNDLYNEHPDLRVCYAHIGQHSPAHVEYINNLPETNKEEYIDLKRELEHLGYNLEVLNK